MRKSCSLTELEKKLLRYIVFNGAQHSDYAVAKQLRVSQTTVNYKIKKLRKAGVITGYACRINPAKVGNKIMAWVFIKVTSDININSFIDSMLGTGKVSIAMVIGGNDDVLLQVFMKNMESLHELIDAINNRFKNKMTNLKVSYVTHIDKLNQVFPVETGEAKLNKTDRQIISYMTENPEAKIAKIAEDLEMHRNTVSSRIKKFWSEQVFLKKTAGISEQYYNDLDIGFRALMVIDTKQGAEGRTASKISKFEQVHELTSLMGHNNLLAVIRTKNLTDCYSFIKNLYRLGLIERASTNLIFASKTAEIRI
ncbi:MAG: Lrp/AsnC family transcriptional regulator [Candidatus Micrarchaeota archaeon]